MHLQVPLMPAALQRQQVGLISDPANPERIIVSNQGKDLIKTSSPEAVYATLNALALKV